MPPETDVIAKHWSLLVYGAPLEPGAPGSLQRLAYHYQRATEFHLAELERQRQQIDRLERRIKRLKAQLARQERPV